MELYSFYNTSKNSRCFFKHYSLSLSLHKKNWPTTASLIDECLSVNALLLHCNYATSNREATVHCDNLSALVDWLCHPAN